MYRDDSKSMSRPTLFLSFQHNHLAPHFARRTLFPLTSLAVKKHAMGWVLVCDRASRKIRTTHASKLRETFWASSLSWFDARPFRCHIRPASGKGLKWLPMTTWPRTCIIRIVHDNHDEWCNFRRIEDVNSNTTIKTKQMSQPKKQKKKDLKSEPTTVRQRVLHAIRKSSFLVQCYSL